MRLLIPVLALLVTQPAAAQDRGAYGAAKEQAQAARRVL